MHADMTAEEYVSHIERDVIPTLPDPSGQSSGLVEWAMEGHQAAKDAYVESSASLDQPYFDAQIVVVDRHLAQSGVRLAAILEQIVAHQ